MLPCTGNGREEGFFAFNPSKNLRFIWNDMLRTKKRCDQKAGPRTGMWIYEKERGVKLGQKRDNVYIITVDKMTLIKEA